VRAVDAWLGVDVALASGESPDDGDEIVAESCGCNCGRRRYENSIGRPHRNEDRPLGQRFILTCIESTVTGQSHTRVSWRWCLVAPGAAPLGSVVRPNASGAIRPGIAAEGVYTPWSALINATDAQLADMKLLAEQNRDPALASHFRKLLRTVEMEVGSAKRSNLGHSTRVADLISRLDTRR
jgi:hypothetical protein